MKDNKQDETKGGVNPVIVAVTGAIVGAGVAVAGTIALQDEKKREKVKGVLSNVKDQAMEYMENMQKTQEDKKNEVNRKFTEGKKEVKKVAREARGVKKAVRTK